MGIIKNSENVILLVCQHGVHKGKKYLFRESIKRFSLIRTYARNRKTQFKDELYLCLSGIEEDGTWAFSSYSSEVSTDNLPVPEVILDIKNNKIYQIEAQLWELPKLLS